MVDGRSTPKAKARAAKTAASLKRDPKTGRFVSSGKKSAKSTTRKSTSRKVDGRSSPARKAAAKRQAASSPRDSRGRFISKSAASTSGKMTIPQIKAELKNRGIKGYSGKNKAQLLAMLNGKAASPKRTVRKSTGRTARKSTKTDGRSSPKAKAAAKRRAANTPRGPDGKFIKKSAKSAQKRKSTSKATKKSGKKGPTNEQMRAALKKKGVKGYSGKNKKELTRMYNKAMKN